MGLRIAAFHADITPPLGYPLCGGWIENVRQIVDPQFARGIVLLGGGEPIVIAALDWCELRGESYDHWQQALAEAAGTLPARVLAVTVHQHDAPLMDISAQRMLKRAGITQNLCDETFHHEAAQRVAAATRAALPRARPLTHIGAGQSKVEQVASNRRVLGADDRVEVVRYSACTDPKGMAAPDGVIDPYLRTLTFFDGETALASLHCYATHPMSHYGKGGVSYDFVGLARQRRQADNIECLQIYTTGCAGNIGAGKYNDGTPPARYALADSIYRAMAASEQSAKRAALSKIDFRLVPLPLPMREEPTFTRADFEAELNNPTLSYGERARGAIGLTWRNRAESGNVIQVPVIGLGPATIIHLPGEPFIEYQLAAQQMNPERFVMTIGYGDGAPGYIPTDAAFDQGGYESGRWALVAPGVEAVMMKALRDAVSACITQ